ncbi:uncharacterized protein BP01DRAFT_219147 [Aspergillus saccharolyticus JOP 1030-1]|uniref:Uncharacterized protein n=1 Tax=Aspergillus saccharolyticus JOP 1030-1 TaxID=1450539 RepID=A0A318ZM75_9EURO|nr:hypothetical protein BP01DRAFT_219147 [Aspergillus saccharolyticus JOP 1030-1]PYH47574.1 hypothetical protein BP01DRAFT_219147 [Aspergillus saccharolyticus JOP 1030-1]
MRRVKDLATCRHVCISSSMLIKPVHIDFSNALLVCLIDTRAGLLREKICMEDACASHGMDKRNYWKCCTEQNMVLSR